jgi:hypothetical protein
MALLSIPEELDRAQHSAPFSTEDEYAGWWSIWCQECNREADCPLLMVAARNRTPAPWVLRDPHAVNRYTCTEYEASNADDPTLIIEETR